MVTVHKERLLPCLKDSTKEGRRLEVNIGDLRAQNASLEGRLEVTGGNLRSMT